MTTPFLRRTAAVFVAGVGALHLVLAPEYMGEQLYVGVLFLLGAAASALVAVRLWKRDDARAWLLGALVSAGMLGGFVLSRTTGLPGFHESEWELSGIVSMLLEAAYLGVFLRALRPIRRALATA
jgi:hypothetical protein